MRAKALVALGLVTVGLGSAPAASAAVSGGAGVDTASTKQSKAQAAPQVQPAQRKQSALAGGTSLDVAPLPEARPTVPGDVAVLKNGIAYAPAAAPIEVQRAIWAANEIQDKPYVYGGGHKSFISRGYDCSGTVSYALNGAGLLEMPLDSTGFMSWGARGRGEWITVYTNPGHAFVVIAGLRLDTSGPGERGPRWRPGKYSTAGFKARHPKYL